VSFFILLKRVIKEMEQMIRAFLWCRAKLNPHKAKVAWKDICCPKEHDSQAHLHLELGFGGQAYLISKCFKILRNPFKFGGYILIDLGGSVFGFSILCPWYWRKLISLRNMAQRHFKWKINNG